MPIGFCYPGRDVRGGDLPPRRECTPLWHPLLRRHFIAVALTLPVGSYAIRHYLPERRRQALSEILTTLARLPAGDFRPAASELAYDALGSARIRGLRPGCCQNCARGSWQRFDK